MCLISNITMFLILRFFRKLKLYVYIFFKENTFFTISCKFIFIFLFSYNHYNINFCRLSFIDFSKYTNFDYTLLLHHIFRDELRNERSTQLKNLNSCVKQMFVASFVYYFYRAYVEARRNFKKRFALVLFKTQGAAQASQSLSVGFSYSINFG